MSKNLNRDHWNDELQDHYPKLIEFTEYAFNKMLACKDVLINDMVEIETQAKTCANLVHDVFEGYAKDYFNDVEGAVAGVMNGVFGIYFKGKCFIRFNKLNDDYSFSNHQSQQRDKFVGQRPMSLFNEEVVYLNLGYKVTPFWNEITGIHLVCWNGTFEWEIDIKNQTTELGQFRLEIVHDVPEFTEQVSRVKVKTSEETKKEEESNKKSS